MGLETVEIVMAVEEMFHLNIPDELAAKLFTVGELHLYVLAELARRGRPAPDPAAVFDTLRNIIVRILRVAPSDVTPDANFVNDLGAS
jgi:acyl carrier protein